MVSWRRSLTLSLFALVGGFLLGLAVLLPTGSWEASHFPDFWNAECR